jgi:hypothetical protein
VTPRSAANGRLAGADPDSGSDSRGWSARTGTKAPSRALDHAAGAGASQGGAEAAGPAAILDATLGAVRNGDGPEAAPARSAGSAEAPGPKGIVLEELDDSLNQPFSIGSETILRILGH